MPLLKVQVSIAGDSVLPRDRTVNTFHLNKEGGPFTGSDYNTLAADTCAAFKLYYLGPREIVTKIYEARGAPPHYPIGQATLDSGLAPASSGPREVAVCLSYYGERNLPRTRGRMFLGVATASRGSSFGRPDSTLRTAVCALGTRIAALGGLDVDWQVYSPTSDEAENVQTCYCDDEWDTIRSRGLRPTTRTQLSISE